jgi:hypothetical protein
VVKTIQLGEILPYGLCRRVATGEPTEYILRFPLLVWLRAGRWCTLSTAVLLWPRPRMAAWWTPINRRTS